MKLKIAVVPKKFEEPCINTEFTWEDFLKRISTPIRTAETYEQYQSFTKEQKNYAKNVGGFIAGESKDGRRHTTSIINRCMITLDLDRIDPNKVNAIFCFLDGLGCKFVVYSTRNYTPVEPRIRIVIPTNRAMTPDEYEPIARKVASSIGMQFMDSTTFQLNRIMYWPSCSIDNEVAILNTDNGLNKEFLDVDYVLNNKYVDWHDVNEWPRVPNENQIMLKNYSGKRLGNPAEKEDIVGLFCSVYNIHSAIETFLSEVYEPRKYFKLLHSYRESCKK